MSRYLKIFLIAISACVLNYYCSKGYLNKRPLGELDETALANKKGIEGLLVGAYSMLDGIGTAESGWGSAASNWVYGSVCGTEAHKGSNEGDQGEEINPLEIFTMTANNLYLKQKWAAVYDGIQRTNEVLRILPKANDIEPDDKERIEAEARFLRGHFHFEAKKMWNRVPFIDETITYGNGNYHVGNEVEIWPKIEADLLFAAENLQADPYGGAVGRANKYTAMALLAKAYIFQKKFLEAKSLLETIISSDRYRLAINYHDNFNINVGVIGESVFTVQHSVNDDSYGQNGNYGDVLNNPVILGTRICCGFFQPTQYFVNRFKTASGLPDFDHFDDTDVSSDEGIDTSQAFTPYEGPVDPRLDWTVGRRGIPYLDWGIHPGHPWVDQTNFGGPFSPKKNVSYRSAVGTRIEIFFWTDGATSNNLDLIRYSEILLWAAEVEIEVGTLPQAREYINQVRRRMIDHPENWVKRADGTNAANYQIREYTDEWTDKTYALKALRQERLVELGMEGHRFFDLVRWGIAETEFGAYFAKEKLTRSFLLNAKFRKGCNEYFPIPQTQIDLSAGADGIAKLEQNDCY